MPLGESSWIQGGQRLPVPPLQADVVSLDRESGGNARVPVMGERRPGARRPVIETARLSFEPLGEQLAVLTEIVEKTSEASLLARAERVGEAARPFGDVPEMLREGLPPLSRWAGVGEKHGARTLQSLST